MPVKLPPTFIRMSVAYGLLVLTIYGCIVLRDYSWRAGLGLFRATRLDAAILNHPSGFCPWGHDERWLRGDREAHAAAA